MLDVSLKAYEEAIEHFEKYVGNDCYTDKFQNSCQLAINALKKEIPAKPETYYNGCPIPDCYCPTCEEEFGWRSGERCPNCGQIIDWSE